MCRATPDQVDCIRAGCSYPINIDTVRGIRHPFCSPECARACGENPRVQPVQIVQQPAAAPPAYTEKDGANVIDMKKMAVGKPKRSLEVKSEKDSASTSYVSPPMTNESAENSDAE